ncbi:hypothetical protein [Hydrocarboniphaga sp.]|uniref:hypothetical protein n=1 Tax=Hydrocarboniphaga sp. TaxID=2033016 RepID=UPI003D0D2F71
MNGASRDEYRTKHRSSRVRLGQRVSHAEFGEGVILSFEGEGERAQIEIRFREAGIKRLMLGFAKLQAM